MPRSFVVYPYKSRLESNYAAHLEARRLIGEILEWAYEPNVFDLGGVCYTPDFRVDLPDGWREYHEVKGYHRNLRDSRTRWRIAAAQHPEYVWCWVTYSRRLGWRVRKATGPRQQRRSARARQSSRQPPA